MRSQHLAGAAIAFAASLIAAPQAVAQTSSSSGEGASAAAAELLPVTYSIASQASETAAVTVEAQAPAIVDPAWEKWRRTQSEALKWEIGYLALSAIDAAQTIECLERDACDEANPIYGRNPSVAKLLLLKAGIGLGHFLMFTELNKRNPKAALRAAQVSVGIQGAFVVLNTRAMF